MIFKPNVVVVLDMVAALMFSHYSGLQVVAHEKQRRIAGWCVERSKSVNSYAFALCKGNVKQFCVMRLASNTSTPRGVRRHSRERCAIEQAMARDILRDQGRIRR
jgi:hypothetical protein